MINTILEAIRYTLTLLFGIFVSTLFLDIKINKKNILIIFGFFYIDLALQAIFYFSKNISSVISLYPLITHLPLFLFFIFIGLLIQIKMNLLMFLYQFHPIPDEALYQILYKNTQLP